MAAIAHGWKPDNPQLAKIPVTVAKEFNDADEVQKRRQQIAILLSRK